MERYRLQVEEAAACIGSRITASPEILIQLGTGLGNFARAMEVELTLPYEDIPHFPVSTVQSHAGRLLIGRLGNRRIAVLQGRLHYYEGYSLLEVCFPIRVLSRIGVQTAIITNASGGLNSGFVPGTLMVMRDHINLIGDNPLRGANIEAWGERFPDLSTPYDPALQQLAMATAKKIGLQGLCCGTYVCIPGPSLETPAETRHLKGIGADAVGMSSVPESIIAIHAGMRVLGISVVANINDPDNFQPILLEDIVQAAGEAEPRMQELIINMLPEV